MKAFLCIHGFGKHQAGFSESMRRDVEALLGSRTVWKEVLWGDLLGSPASFHSATMAAETPALVRAFYEGPEGDAIRARVAQAAHAASGEAGGGPVVLIGHSLGAAIAYETLARGLAPEARALVMLAPPMGLFNHPEMFPTGAPGYPHVEGDRLPEDVFALSFRNPNDWFAAPLGEDFPDVSEREVLPPPGTSRGANHLFYWASQAVAESVAAAAVRAASDAGEPPATDVEYALLARAVDDSLWTPARAIRDENGEIIGTCIS